MPTLTDQITALARYDASAARDMPNSRRAAHIAHDAIQAVLSATGDDLTWDLYKREYDAEYTAQWQFILAKAGAPDAYLWFGSRVHSVRNSGIKILQARSEYAQSQAGRLASGLELIGGPFTNLIAARAYAIQFETLTANNVVMEHSAAQAQASAESEIS